MPNKITRESLISPDIVKVAISKNTMFDLSEDGESVVEVPIPDGIKVTGIIPEGYSVDHYLDPSIVIYTLAKKNITTIEQLSDDLFAKVMQAMNGADNLTIAPSSVVEGKREVIENSLIEMRMEDAATGIIPEGYSVANGLFANMKGIINDADNVTIAPSFVVEWKRKGTENALMKMKMEGAAQAEKSEEAS